MGRFFINSCKMSDDLERLEMNETEKLEVFQLNNKIKARLSSSESSLIQEFKTFEEAKAFNQGYNGLRISDKIFNSFSLGR